MHGIFDAKIIKVIFRGKPPWDRMDICVQSPAGRMQTVAGEFLEHYHPEDVPRFDVKGCSEEENGPMGLNMKSMSEMKNNNKNIFFVVTMFLVSCLLSTGAAAESAGKKLYATRLQSVTVPQYIQEQSAKSIGAALSSTYIYVVLVCDGKPVWTSPKQKIVPNQTKFEWPDSLSSTAVFLWKKNYHVTMRVFLSGSFFSDRILFEIDCSPKNIFPVDGRLEHTIQSLGEKYTASITFKLLATKTSVQQGELEVGKKYAIRLQGVMLSTKAALKGQKHPEESRYYIEFQQGDRSYRFLNEDPITITPDMVNRPEVYTVLDNTGETTRINIYEDDLTRDDLVFSSTMEKQDGKSWVFIGKAKTDDEDDNSYVIFDTFGPLK